MMKIFLSVLLTLTTYSFSQEQQASKTVEVSAQPDAPSATLAAFDGASAENLPLRSLGNPPAALVMRTFPPTKPKKTVDRSFVLLTLFQFVGSVADIETTQYGLRHGTHEGNPLFGRHPSRAVQYGVTIPLSAGVALLSYRLKKRAPESKHWIIPQAVYGSIHAGSAGRNLFVVAGD